MFKYLRLLCRGMGRQSQLMWVGIAGYWGFGVPLGYTLAFRTNLHLSGLWLGSLTGASIVGKPAPLTSCTAEKPTCPMTCCLGSQLVAAVQQLCSDILWDIVL